MEEETPSPNPNDLHAHHNQHLTEQREVLMEDLTDQMEETTKNQRNSDKKLPHEGSTKIARPIISFREAVSKSTQWFEEAKGIITASKDLNEEQEDMTPEGNLVVHFDKNTLARLRNPWKHTLMGKCLGLNIKSSYMETRVRAMWRIKGTLEIIDVGKGVFYFRFSTEEDYEKTLFGGPWFILDHYLMLTTWKPNFRPSLHNFDKIMVWARFSELPVEYYDKEALFCIAGLAGKPIRVDYATDKLTRARYARVFIEVDLDKPLITKVWVGGDWQTIAYENLDTLCFECGRIGHVKQNCLNKKHLDQSSPYIKDLSSNDCDLPSSSSAQSTKQLHLSTNNFMVLNNEENLFSISTSKNINDNREFQHVAPSSKPLGDDTLAVGALNPCSTPTNNTSNSPKNAAVPITHSPSSTLSLSSPKKTNTF
ncbi:uncharacterized protein [Spinacia oleracea]|uniref:CCHC-type domain-containing protein n=1 Tax=Spinacia oleracea TaxID=3562 RepID=A0ABM3RSU2_SPIOL|nr:uncharacterized protein LOC130472203 [Spinacia oleracea]